MLNEQFTDGELTYGSDADDGNFVRQNGTGQTLNIISDGVIGSGNALAYNSPSNGSCVVVQMQRPAVLGMNVGDRIDFSFDFRMTQLPSSPNTSLFRFGLFNHTGAALTDGGGETNPDSGYVENFRAGGSAGAADWGKESGGNDSVLGGVGAYGLPSGTTIQPVDINDTNHHHVLSRITRTAAGISLVTYFDNIQVDSYSDNSAPFTSFNEVAFRLTGQAAAAYDNILVQTHSLVAPTGTAIWNEGDGELDGGGRMDEFTDRFCAREWAGSDELGCDGGCWCRDAGCDGGCWCRDAGCAGGGDGADIYRWDD